MKTITPEEAKKELKRRGHSYRSAAEEIGRSYQWICQVLNGQMKSQPVLRAVFHLSQRTPPVIERRPHPLRKAA